MSGLPRREVLERIARLGALAVLPGAVPLGCAAPSARPPAPAQRDLIHAENRRPGDSDWRLEKTKVDPPTKYRCPAGNTISCVHCEPGLRPGAAYSNLYVVLTATKSLPRMISG